MKKLPINIPRERIAAFCMKWDIVEFSLFGSVLRDDFNYDSDIDVLVSFAESAKHTLYDLVRMENELKEIFDHEIDIVSKHAIEASRNYLRRNAILNSAEPVYAAG